MRVKAFKEACDESIPVFQPSARCSWKGDEDAQHSNICLRNFSRVCLVVPEFCRFLIEDTSHKIVIGRRLVQSTRARLTTPIASFKS